jgi:adenylate cyclase
MCYIRNSNLEETMGRQLPPLKSLPAFEAAARHLSFTRAAEELHVTQSAISQQVKALEEYLGVALFRRISRGLELSDEGRRYFPLVRDSLGRLRSGTRELLSMSDQAEATGRAQQRVREALLKRDGKEAVDQSELLPIPLRPSLAVLPFDNLGGGQDQEYFTDGIVGEITSALSRIRSFFVIDRNSAFTYRDRGADAKQVSRELGVRYLVEGSVRRSGDHVRITAQLIDATSGTNVWADHYDGSMKNVFALQDSLTESIVGAIEPQLRLAEIIRSRRKRPDDFTAYDLFLRAGPNVNEMTPEGNQKAIELLRQAIKIDPNYASAMALLAWCFTLRVAHGWVRSKDIEAAEALQLAEAAIRRSEDRPEVLWLSGYAKSFFGENMEDGLVLIERALELNPNAAQAWVFSGFVNMYIGRADRSVEHFRRAMRLNPLDPTGYRTHSGLAFAYLCLRQYDEAVSWGRRAMHESSRFAVTHRVLAASLAHAGQTAEAKRIVDALLTLIPGLTITRYRKETRFRFSDYFEQIVDGLRKAGLPE